MNKDVESFKVTYSTMDADRLKEFHQQFDLALTKVKNETGNDHQNWVNGEKLESESSLEKYCPTDHSLILGKFSQASKLQTDTAIQAAQDAFVAWNLIGWEKRCELLLKAAEIIRERRYYLSAVMSLEVGKNRLEAMGDTEESADLIRYYCQIMAENNGFVQQMGRLATNENVKAHLLPFGVWGVIAPFNFPLALSAGMAAGALVAGNTVVYKPSSDAPWTGTLLNQIFVDAGIPKGVFNLVNGPGSVVGEALVSNPAVDGLVFTGSKDIGMNLYHRFSKIFPKPCIIEMGGKNPAIVTGNADLEAAAEGIMRSSFGLGGQKCSACSRAYIDKNVFTEFMDILVKKTRAILIGDPTAKEIFLGPLVNMQAYIAYQSYIESAKMDGRVIYGGNVCTGSEFEKGYFVEPAIITDLPEDHHLVKNELFCPILYVQSVQGLQEALALANDTEYGLTAGLFSNNEKEINTFFNSIRAGVTYVNRRSGATTGAWPGVQPFCGWQSSGSTGKGCCGPYYVTQFMREQSRTIMETAGYNE